MLFRSVDEADEPGIGFKPAHHHDADRARAKSRGDGKGRHWKRKEWKRRTAQRRARAIAFSTSATPSEDWVRRVTPGARRGARSFARAARLAASAPIIR